ncbi:hypothetical protein WR25_02543 [Diploscapter pachys]|uniref:ShKT domain-containing protein n=1 Tax=Diploscapter pachys TaxID=2018661 RepID=A0A2A2KU27_9BILA|nr:hypothetical protein WR25_02543 [Diploscapter pachys]
MPQYLSILVTVALFAGIDAQINDPLECTEIGTQGNLTGQTEPNGTTIDPSMKAGAIKNCPKDPAWRQPIANSCPNKCGMCLDGGCVDKAVDCSADASICNNINLQAFVNENCQRTCQRCSALTTAGSATTQPGGGSVTTAGGGGTACVDNSPSCAAWTRDLRFVLRKIIISNSTDQRRVYGGSFEYFS